MRHLHDILDLHGGVRGAGMQGFTTNAAHTHHDMHTAAYHMQAAATAPLLDTADQGMLVEVALHQAVLHSNYHNAPSNPRFAALTALMVMACVQRVNILYRRQSWPDSQSKGVGGPQRLFIPVTAAPVTPAAAVTSSVAV